MAKQYTAQEMRDVAQCLHYNSPTKLTVEAAAMLRQAAACQVKRVLASHRSEMRDKRKLCAEVKRITKIEELLTSENYRLHNEMAEQSAVNASLRAFVKELADCALLLKNEVCVGCPQKLCACEDQKCSLVKNTNALVAKALEVVK